MSEQSESLGAYCSLSAESLRQTLYAHARFVENDKDAGLPYVLFHTVVDALYDLQVYANGEVSGE